jgi:uncharacterized repeat protein (TIGR03847 family)
MLIHRYEMPQRFVTGTVGPPGERTFFLQARDGARVTSVALEKQQVLVLAERLEEMLEQVSAQAEGEAASAFAVDPPLDTEPLDQPIEEEFRVGTMTLAWDDDASVVVVEAFAETDAEDEEATEALEVHVPVPMARGFTARAKVVVAAGRPQCPFCGSPMDPTGHLCPRSNGFLRVARD